LYNPFTVYVAFWLALRLTTALVAHIVDDDSPQAEALYEAVVEINSDVVTCVDVATGGGARPPMHPNGMS